MDRSKKEKQMQLQFQRQTSLKTDRQRRIQITIGASNSLTFDRNNDDYDGCFSASHFDMTDWQDVGHWLATEFPSASGFDVSLDDSLVTTASLDWLMWLSFGLALSGYQYQHVASATLSPLMAEFTVETSSSLQAAFNMGKTLAQGQCVSRELMNKPGNVLYPGSFVEAVRHLPWHQVALSVLDEAQLLSQGFGGLMGVAQGSDRLPRVLCLDHQPESPLATVVLVGKGVTFDSGGISLKQPRFMSTMKVDMGGAAAVVGAMYALSQMGLPLRIVGLCGLVENMPSGCAMKPGDVVTMLSGKSVEIISTDAEGRMVLADVLYYAQTQYQPDYLIDIATLTGGTGVALGKAFASLMGNSLGLIKQAQKAGKECGEPLWHMPIGGLFEKALESDFADLRHGSEEPDGSPCVAATFLSQFVSSNQQWVHIDSAAMSLGMTHRKIYPKATTGYGVLLLSALCRQIAQHSLEEVQS